MCYRLHDRLFDTKARQQATLSHTEKKYADLSRNSLADPVDSAKYAMVTVYC